MGTIKDRKGQNLTETDEIKKRWQEYTEKLYNKGLAAAKSLRLCPTLCDPMEAAYQAPLSLGFSRQEYWNGLSFPSPKKGLNDLDNQDGVVTHQSQTS